MIDKIFEYYKIRGIILPQEEIEIISGLIEEKTYNKKEFIFKKGDRNLASHYILKGCVRVFIEDVKNIEYNRFFGFEDWWIGEYQQIISDKPSKTSAQVLEKTTTLCIDKNAYDLIFATCPVFTKETLHFYLSSYAKMLENEEIKKTMTIEDLYINYVINKPNVLNRVPLYHVASYLGVKPESLSRVKKKFKGQSL